ncbi:MAG: hypothetical protein ABSG43_24680 [Solirubrobacteraceae bacterium]
MGSTPAYQVHELLIVDPEKRTRFWIGGPLQDGQYRRVECGRLSSSAQPSSLSGLDWPSLD